MRTLSSTLLAAQKSASAVPFVQVTVSDRVASVSRLHWERLYAGSETDRYHAAVIPEDGSLIRMRTDPSGPNLYFQRVTSPGPGSAFGSWTNLGTFGDAGVALAASGANVMRFFVATDGRTIQLQESTNNGASFGATTTPTVSGTAVTWVAAARRSDGGALLVYATGGSVYTVKRTSGVWGSAVAWPYSASQITGLAVVHAGDYHLAIAAVEATGQAKLWTAVYGDGASLPAGTWSALQEVSRAESASAVGLRAPSLAVLDTHRYFFVEEYTGSQSYSRPQGTWFPPTQTFPPNSWREPVPFDVSSSFGVAITGSSSYAWLSSPSGVWRAPLVPAQVDVSEDVLELGWKVTPRGGVVRLLLRNDDGRYNGLSGSYAPVRPGAEVAVSAGYRTSAGQEVSSGPRFWVEGWEFATAGGEATFEIVARDVWSLLEGWRARRQYAWAAGSDTITQILRVIFGRVGVELINVGSSDASATLKPAFTIHPGEDGARAIERLLAMVPDALLISGSLAILFEPLATDDPDYAYGTDHAISRGRYASDALAANRVQVFGQSVLAEGFSWAEIDTRLDELRQVHDLNLTTVAQAQDRAAATLRQEELSLALGELVSPPNCGQELYDVVSVTDPSAGLDEALYRVLGSELRYRRRGPSPAYEQRLLLGTV